MGLFGVIMGSLGGVVRQLTPPFRSRHGPDSASGLMSWPPQTGPTRGLN
jgi:hypothetical protein